MLAEIAWRLASGATSSRALVDDALALSQSAAAAHVFINTFGDAARMAADSRDLWRRAGECEPLNGIPVTVKANLDVAGHVTTAGSMILGDGAPATKDAAAVRRLKRAGMVVLGQTNMTEFAFSGLGLNPHFGTPLNPAFDRPHIPGGSSAGAAVSVALGIAPAAIATDTGGSVRIPAALCGLVGFKPTAAAISTTGVAPLSHTLDTVGVIARSVDDCAILFDVLANDAGIQTPRMDQDAGHVAGMRIGVISNYVNDGMEPAVANAVDRALHRLSEAGAVICSLAIPELDTIPQLTARGSFSAMEAFAFYQAKLLAGRDRVDPRVLARLEPGGRFRASDYLDLQAGRRALIEAFERHAAGFDLVVMPTVPLTAPALSAFAEDEAYHSLNGLILRNPTVVNLVDGCAISIPCQSVGESPVGLSFAAPGGCDCRLLGLAARLQLILAR